MNLNGENYFYFQTGPYWSETMYAALCDHIETDRERKLELNRINQMMTISVITLSSFHCSALGLEPLLCINLTLSNKIRVLLELSIPLHQEKEVHRVVVQVASYCPD